jgi:hypothetical protein
MENWSLVRANKSFQQHKPKLRSTVEMVDNSRQDTFDANRDLLPGIAHQYPCSCTQHRGILRIGQHTWEIQITLFLACTSKLKGMCASA